MILHSCESVTWTPIEKKVWSTALKKTVDFSFVRWNLSDDYNYKMNDNDVADQIRLVYWIIRFQRLSVEHQVVVGALPVGVQGVSRKLLRNVQEVLRAQGSSSFLDAPRLERSGRVRPC
jgi:hypothetical protein